MSDEATLPDNPPGPGPATHPESEDQLVPPAAAPPDTGPPPSEPLPEPPSDESVAESEPDLGPPPPVEPREGQAIDLTPILAEIRDLGRRLDGRIDGLQTLFDREIRAESTREKIVDRLHAELQDYKNDLLHKVLRPVFLDLIQLHDDVDKMIATLDGDDRGSGLLRAVQQGLEDVLYRQGVEPFTEADGQPFDPRRQRAISTVPTDDPSQNRAIAGRLRKGFAAADKVVRPEQVAVFTHRPGSA